jgi:fucose 4-O-acetylase-like acetyltransferase
VVVPSELIGSLVTVLLIVLTFVFPRARVLTIPFFFVLLIILIFWSARRHAERQDLEEER